MEQAVSSVSKFKASSFKPANMESAETVHTDNDDMDMDVSDDEKKNSEDDIDGAPIDDLDGMPIDNIDDIDGEPIDGEPIDGEPIDGEPIDDIDGIPV